MDLTKLLAYDYTLPDSQIAQFPLSDRSASRLLCLDKTSGYIRHTIFREIENFFRAGDILVINTSKVFPARLFAYKENGTKIETLLLHPTTENTWLCMVSPGKRLKKSQWITFSDRLKGFVSLPDDNGFREVRFEYEGDFFQELCTIGHIPLPPYIKRNDENQDKETYQTVYAKELGSAAAPTAGLHFTTEVLSALKAKGVKIVEVVLHVGVGTFLPVKTECILEHRMHKEHCFIDPSVAEVLNAAKLAGQRIIAVGTTSVRTLESFWNEELGMLNSGNKWTDIFIHPGKKLNVVNALITNFHLPQSTLIMLVCAIAGYNQTMHAYKVAVDEGYRFFSYGDAMFIADSIEEVDDK